MSVQSLYDYLNGVTDAASTASGDKFIAIKSGAMQRVDQNKLLASLDISALSAATSIASADLVLVSQSATNKKATTSLALGTYMLGHKAGLLLSYVSSDTLSLSVGITEVNGTMVSKTSATTINSSTTNYPSAGSWAYVLIDSAGTVTLAAATGTAAQRPTNALFQLTGSSVGYDDIAKHGYYYDATHRVIGAFHKVGSTSFYFVNMGSRTEEIGQNSNGRWTRDSIGEQRCRITDVSANGSAKTWTFPVAFADTAVECNGNVIAGNNYALFTNFAAPSASSVSWGGIVYNTGTFYAGTVNFALTANGRFR